MGAGRCRHDGESTDMPMCVCTVMAPTQNRIDQVLGRRVATDPSNIRSTLGMGHGIPPRPGTQRSTAPPLPTIESAVVDNVANRRTGEQPHQFAQGGGQRLLVKDEQTCDGSRQRHLQPVVTTRFGGHDVGRLHHDHMVVSAL